MSQNSVPKNQIKRILQINLQCPDSTTQEKGTVKSMKILLLFDFLK